MIRDFNTQKHPGLQATIFSLKAFLMVILLAFVWEYIIEDDVFSLVSNSAAAEPSDEKIEYMLTVTVFVFIALIAPTHTLYTYIRRRDVAEDQARHLATHDPMTNLPNRKLFFDRLDQAIAQAHRHKGKLAVMFIDLNDFKEINDLMGHNAGDFVLKVTAASLINAVRETDTVARFGGDEFVCIITDVHDNRQLQALADRIKVEITAPTQFEGKAISVSASIGYAVYPEHATTAKDLISMADKAMYKDKNSPGEQVRQGPRDGVIGNISV